MAALWRPYAPQRGYVLGLRPCAHTPRFFRYAMAALWRPYAPQRGYVLGLRPCAHTPRKQR